MNHLFAFVVFVHSLIHIMGFIKECELVPVSQLLGITTTPLGKNAALVPGTCWLIACLLFVTTLVSHYMNKDWWWMTATAGVLLSQSLIIIYWKDAKWGTIANLFILVAGFISYANWSFNRMVRLEVKQLYASVDQNYTVTGKHLLSGLPAPVENWLLNSGVVGRPAVQTLRLRQKGFMRSTPEQKNWLNMQAEQYFRIDEPSFIWRARMQMMPAGYIMARDKYVEGKGEMKIKIMSVVRIASSTGYKVDQGTLQRYLAEMCWFPSAALSPYVKWKAIDAWSAEATLTYNGVSGSVVFHFDERGNVTGCDANRYMSSGANATLEKWQVRSTEHGLMNGIRIPVKSEATWKLKSGDFTWLRLEIINIEYNKRTTY